MSQQHLKRDEARRLRNAAASACARRGANVGTVIDVIDILHEENLLSSSVTTGSVRQLNKRRRVDWRQQYCNCISLPCDDGSSVTWHTMTPHAALQFFVDKFDMLTESFSSFYSIMMKLCPEMCFIRTILDAAFVFT